MANVIQVEQITKDYGSGKGVFDVSLEVKKGEVFGYLGPNGAGKTTTIRQLMGFIRPDKGFCKIQGMDCFSQSAQIQKSLGYLAGEIAFMDDMKGMEFLNFMADMKGMKDRSRIQELMHRFELDPRGKIRKMSKGMKQKIGIICAFMDHPEVLILDEPTSGLDPLMQNRFIELIQEEKKRGTTILMSSHLFEEVEKTCDRAAIIRDGRIVVVEDMIQLAKKKQKTYDVKLKDEQEAERLAQNTTLQIRGRRGRHVEIAVRQNIKEALRILNQYEMIDLDVKSQTLEEIFMHYYGNTDKIAEDKSNIKGR
ncbi:MAG TPA: ABC transporter ATP-binding protein [Candidatus Pelethocola excrementipullorum]|nr:ABC transporter ATP-binding protein [Candidatus Pelethocola excrementipullorum]